MADTGRCRIIINGRWNSQEFADLFSEMEFLNDVASFSIRVDQEVLARDLAVYAGHFRYYGRSFYSRPLPPFLEGPLPPFLEEQIESLTRRLELRYFINRFQFQSDLTIKAISFGSPGFVDFLGAGKIVAEIRKFILGVIDRYLETEDRRLARDAKRQEILEKKITNAERLLKLGKKVGLEGEFRRNMMREVLAVDYFIESKLLDGKIVRVDEEDGDR